MLISIVNIDSRQWHQVVRQGEPFMRRPSKNLRVDLNTDRSELLRAKLMREISEYERQLADMRANTHQVNFTMMQTYKELITARQIMLRHLPTQY